MDISIYATICLLLMAYPMTPGIFSAQSRIIIDAPIETVWSVLLDFPAYPAWNPFVTSQVIADGLFLPLTDQTPHENLRLIIEAQNPPLPAPVNENTPYSFENITAIDHVNHRTAWRQIMIPSPLLSAERWQALSTVDGKTLYEAREEFGAPLSYVVDALFAAGLQEGFDAQADALKARVESVG